jgi:hypothetical protein
MTGLLCSAACMHLCFAMRLSADLVSILPAVQKTMDAVSPSVEMAKKKYIEAHDLVVVRFTMSLLSLSCGYTSHKLSQCSMPSIACGHGSSSIVC